MHKKMVKFKREKRSSVPIIKMVQHSTNNQFQAFDEKYILKAKDFSYGIRPIYYFSRAIGLMPYTIIRNPTSQVYESRVRLFDALWFAISIFFYIMMAISSYYNMKMPHDSNLSSYILILGDFVLLILNLIVAAIIIIMDMCNRFKLVKILNTFIIVDKSVSQFFF